MKRAFWITVDRWMRSIHLYTGVFLVPWVVVYAVSAFCLNHHQWINDVLGVVPAQFQVVQEVPFQPDDSFPTAIEEQAEAILARVQLEGPHRVQRRPAGAPLLINRLSGIGNYRITWASQRGLIVVERQQPFSLIRFTHFLHFRSGYGFPYAVTRVWAAVVDFVAASMLFWVISGVYIWARRPHKRALGGAFLLAGIVLFAVLVVGLCR